MYDSLLIIHSTLRYVALLFIVFAIIKSVSGWMGNKPFLATDKKMVTFSVIAVHTQLLIGLALYFMSPVVKAGMADMVAAMKDKLLRFYTVEHIAMMMIAIVLITLGSALSKRAKTDLAKHKKVAIFFILALIIIFVSIPWPFMTVGAGRSWF
jgi:hypothetical protein